MRPARSARLRSDGASDQWTSSTVRPADHARRGLRRANRDRERQGRGGLGRAAGARLGALRKDGLREPGVPEATGPCIDERAVAESPGHAYRPQSSWYIHDASAGRNRHARLRGTSEPAATLAGANARRASVRARGRRARRGPSVRRLARVLLGKLTAARPRGEAASVGPLSAHQDQSILEGGAGEEPVADSSLGGLPFPAGEQTQSGTAASPVCHPRCGDSVRLSRQTRKRR